ncbi:MAG: hypothetical protein ACK44B_03735, partial [Flavobacteriales bacterium]
MGNNPILQNDPVGDTIRKTKAFTKQYSQAYRKFAKSEAGKQFIKDYDRGGKYEHISIIFDLADVGEAGTGGYTEMWSMSKTGNDPIQLDGEQLNNSIDLISNKTDNYVQARIFMNPSYGNPGYAVTELEKVEAGGSILHETQHVRIGTVEMYNGNDIPSPFSQHSTLDSESNIYYWERVKYWYQNTSVWYHDFIELKKQTIEADRKKKLHPDSTDYNPKIYKG